MARGAAVGAEKDRCAADEVLSETLSTVRFESALEKVALPSSERLNVGREIIDCGTWFWFQNCVSEGPVDSELVSAQGRLDWNSIAR